MRIHNICFYEDLTKIIFELSSNIIKYAPYFFCWASILVILQASVLLEYEVLGCCETFLLAVWFPVNSKK